MSYQAALSDFHKARRQAAMEQIMARLRGESAELLSYEEVRQKLKARTSAGSTLKEIPLDAIVGSVGRYLDFTRSFLPRSDSIEQRWARVQVAVTGMEGVPPIEVYQIGDAYFVRDGNHRVSVARQLGASHIQAYVTQVATRVPLTPEVRLEDLILKAEYNDFLEQTDLDTIRPEADLTVTEPGQYIKILEHIAVHRYFMGIEQQREIPYQEAVTHWYDEVYAPVVEIIRERGILRDFPNRTETDLYLWVLDHRAALEKALGWPIGTESAADDLAAQYSSRRQRVVARAGGRIRDAVLPEELNGGPPPGQWREGRLAPRQEDRLFADVLVPVSGKDVGWSALTQALEVARREGANLHGLHVVPTEEEKEGEETRAIVQEFERQCQLAGVSGKLIVETGKVSRSITGRSRWADLVVVNLAHPPGSWALARLSSGFRTLLLNCTGPVLAVPGISTPMSRVLLAYDGTPKAEEALFVATYLAGRWALPLTVVVIPEPGISAAEVQEHARQYLSGHDVQATFVIEPDPVPEGILKTAEAQGCDLILMGGYGHNPMLEAVIGSAVDHVLRESHWPVLICR